MTGLHLSHYRIDAEIGRGGMGIVYRAFDTKLDRTVAIKVLPTRALATDDDRARFFREAKAAAALHHPNIATVFGIDEAVPEGGAAGSEPRLFIAMEYIDGETLRERIERGPLKLEEAVLIASQIAEALKAAHTKEIVHRDIKSANVMLTSAGVVKVLDFGLAKTRASTMLTQLGSTLGTVAYMSPEQARGDEVDGRTDLYSLGTVLYEMIAGRLPFVGDYEQAILYSILNEDPEPLTAVRTGVPMGLELIASKLLAKEPRHRYQTAADLQADLETVDLKSGGFSRTKVSIAAPDKPRPGSKMLWAGVAVVALMLSGLAGYRLGSTGNEPQPRHTFRFSVPTGSVRPGEADISADGRYLAYAGRDTSSNAWAVYLRDFATPEAVRIPGSEDGRAPRFSPDSRMLVFVRDGSIFRYPLAGGDVIELPVGIGFTAAEWLDERSLLYQPEDAPTEIRAIDLFGNPIRTQVRADSTRGHQALWLAGSGIGDGRAMILAEGQGTDDLALANFDTGLYTVISEFPSEPFLVKSRHLVYASYEGGLADGHLVKVIRPDFSVTTNPVRLPDRLPWAARFTMAGHLVSTSSDGQQHLRLSSLAVDSGAWTNLLPDQQGHGQKIASPDGERAAWIEERSDVVIENLSDRSRMRLTPELEGIHQPVWSADGTELFIADGDDVLWRLTAHGGKSAERLLGGEMTSSGMHLDAVSQDGRKIALAVRDSGETVVLSLEDGARQVISLDADRWQPEAFSPDGEYLLLSTFSGSKMQVVIYDLVDERSWAIDDSRLGTWSRDGRTLYTFSRSDQTIYRRSVDMNLGVRLGAPSVVARVPGRDYVVGLSVHPEGDRLFVEHVEFPEVTEHSIDVALNYDLYLEQIAPSGR